MEGAREVDLAVAQAQKDLAEAIFAGSTQFLKDAQALERTDPSKDLRIALAMAQIETAEANLAVAKQFADELSGLPRREDMESAQAAVQASQATLRQVELQIKQQQIMAPYDGTILNHLVSLSELVQPGWPVLSFSNLGRLSVSVFVPQGDLNWVKVGQTVKVEFDSTTGANMIGNVVHIKDQAEFTPRNIQTPDERSILVHKVTVEVANPDDSLRPGLYADVIFEEPS
jgi:HlyD family secretion protein